MKKPHKKSFVIFTILSLVLFVAVAALIVLEPIIVHELQFGDLFDYLKPIYFTYPELIDEVLSFKTLSFSVLWIAAAVFALYFLIMLFVAIFGIRRKKAAKTFGILIAIFGIAVSYFGVSVFYAYIRTASEYVKAEEYVKFAWYIGADLATLLFMIFATTAIIAGVRYAHAAMLRDTDVIPEGVNEPEEDVKAEPEEAAKLEDIPVFMPEPEDEAIDPQNMSSTALSAIIKDIVRDIIRDELQRNNLVSGQGQLGTPGNDSHQDNHSVVGATFGGPLIVQYFNGAIQSASNPAPEQAEEPAPVEEPVQEEVQEEPAPVEEPVQEEPAPAPVPAAPKPVVEEPKEAKNPIVRIPFEERLLASEKELQDIYSELKNEILSYGVKSRVSSSGDTFRLHRKTYVKMTVAGKSLKLYFALNPDDYRESAIPVQDASEKSIYTEIPLVFKVKSPLSVRRCKQLIQDVMEKDNLEQGEIGTVNWIKELKAEMKARKADKK